MFDIGIIVRTKRRRAARDRGFTIVELVIMVAILATLAAIGFGVYTKALLNSRNTRAIGDIKTMEGDIILFYTEHRRYPDSLAEVGYGDREDPWGNLYQYLNIETASGKGKMRKDRFLVPLNADFDLYSMGPDGMSTSPLTAKVSRDDILRANNGGYVGPASEY
jgi:general secretion pathway protein G